MPCYYPVTGIITSHNGKRKFIPKKGITHPDTPLTVPCGRCIGCRLENSKMWTIRCLNEMHFHEHNTFLTLTYAPEHLPKSGTLVKKHLQDFFKRYRKNTGVKIRYFACGEYGDNLSRPHYHILVFGHRFNDEEIYKTSIKGDKYYISPTLNKLWPFGHAIIGEANMQTAAYISRYVTKKINGSQADKHYQGVDLDTGELVPILGEYATMSNRPGIGAQFYEEYKNDIYPSDEIIHDGKYFPVPRYYDVLLERDDPKLFEKVKQARIDNFEALKVERPDEFKPKRLIQKEKCKQAQIALHLKRNYENDT